MDNRDKYLSEHSPSQWGHSSIQKEKFKQNLSKITRNLYTNRGSLCYPGFAIATLIMWNMAAVNITLIFTLFYYTQ